MQAPIRTMASTRVRERPVESRTLSNRETGMIETGIEYTAAYGELEVEEST